MLTRFSLCHAVCLPAWTLVLLAPAPWLEAAEEGLSVGPLRGIPTLFRDGVAVAPLMADPGAAGGVTLRDGSLHFDDVALQGRAVHFRGATQSPSSLSVRVVVSRSYYDGDEGSKVYFGLHPADSRRARYLAVLSVRGGQHRLVVERWDSEGPPTRPADVPLDWRFGVPIQARLAVDGARVSVEVDGQSVISFEDPVPLVPGGITLGGYRTAGYYEQARVEDLQGAVLVEDDFADPDASLSKWEGPGLEDPRLGWAHSDIHLYTTDCVNLADNWRGPGEYDWRSVDSILDSLSRYDPEGLLLARVRINAPQWWMKLHPDQVMHAYVEGKDAPEPRSFPSFSSEQWRQEAAEALRALIRHLGEHPEGHRLAGMNLGAGHALEWVYYFSPDSSADYYDYSPAQRDGFAQFLRGQYGTLEALREAWKDPQASFETVSIPTPAERRAGKYFEFFDPAASRRVPDYLLYHSRAVSGALTHFAQAVKEESRGRMLTLAFYGYHFSAGKHFHDATGAHADLHRVLECPYLDALCNPHSYQVRHLAGSTLNYVPQASARLHGKPLFDENDTRTHLSDPLAGFGRTSTPWETANVLKRDLAQALSQSAGMWFWDWGKGWFKDAPTMAAVKDFHRIAAQSLERDREPCAEIAVVVSTRSKQFVRGGTDLLRNLYSRQFEVNIPRIGAPFDLLLVDDLPRARDYKLYIFLDTFYLSDADRQAIRQRVLGGGRTVLWIFAPGFITDDGLSLSAMSDLTGIQIKAVEAPLSAAGDLHMSLADTEHPYTRGVNPGTTYFVEGTVGPVFFADDPAARTLGMSASLYGGGDYPGYHAKPGFVVKQMEDWTSVWSGLPVLPPVVLRNIARHAGVHIYCDGDDFVTANRFMVAVHALSSGERFIRLPEVSTVVDAMTGEQVAHQTREFRAPLQRGETGLWLLER